MLAQNRFQLNLILLFNDNDAKTIQVSDEHIAIKCDTKKYKLGEKVLLIPSHCDPSKFT